MNYVNPKHTTKIAKIEIGVGLWLLVYSLWLVVYGWWFMVRGDQKP